MFFVKQHGFKQKHSTETSLGELVGNLVEIFDKIHRAIVGFMDLMKAFDNVEYIVLKGKLSCCFLHIYKIENNL